MEQGWNDMMATMAMRTGWIMVVDRESVAGQYTIYLNSHDYTEAQPSGQGNTLADAVYQAHKKVC